MARRRVFVSTRYHDEDQARGFTLLPWAKNVDVDFVGRHLLSPVNSENDAYIRRKVREQMDGTSVTVVLLGNNTQQSDWVAWEIEESVNRENPNGVLAIKLKDSDVTIDPSSPVGEKLRDAGAEVLEWEPNTFSSAIERAAQAGRRGAKIRAGIEGSDSCAR